MWKVVAGFIVFAGIALFVVMKAGDKVDMQGEAGHGTTSHSLSASEPASSAGSAPDSSK